MARPLQRSEVKSGSSQLSASVRNKVAHHLQVTLVAITLLKLLFTSSKKACAQAPRNKTVISKKPMIGKKGKTLSRESRGERSKRASGGSGMRAPFKGASEYGQPRVLGRR